MLLLLANAHALAAAAPPIESAAPASLWDYLLQYGLPGLVIIGFLTGQIVPGRQAKRVEDENDRLRKMVEDKLLPVVTQNTSVTEQAIQLIAELQDKAVTPPPRRRPPSQS